MTTKVKIRTDSPAEASLLDALRAEDEAITEAAARLDEARAVFRIAAVKYAAVRGMVTGWLAGQDPYEIPDDILHSRSKGKYRYLLMDIGDAAVLVLRHAAEPMSLIDIVQQLHWGGLMVDGRTVNAALLRMKGRTKLDDGTYVFDGGAALSGSLGGYTPFEREEDEF